MAFQLQQAQTSLFDEFIRTNPGNKALERINELVD